MSARADAQGPLPALAYAPWASQACWTLLDTGFDYGQAFLATWHCWRTHARRPGLLHYVGLLSAAEARALAVALAQHAARHPELAELAETLGRLCYGLEPGFQRILLEGGMLSLTLCVGEVGPLLGQQAFQADTLRVGPAAFHWDKWALKALARCCKRGSTLFFTGTLPDPDLLRDAGFAVAADSPTGSVRYDPRWQLRRQRRTPPQTARTPVRCAVVGASVARALALRGWQVDVYDTQGAPAGGAAGLPVGLVVPHHSADDSPRSRMSRVGTRLMLQHAAERLQAGSDWQPGGVLERCVADAELPDVEAEVRSETAPGLAPTGWAQAMDWQGMPGLWHPYAAWVRPARLVQEWLTHPGIRFHGLAPVQALERMAGQWTLRDGQGAEIGRADIVVLANAHGCAALVQGLAQRLPADFPWVPDALEKLQRLQTLQGTLSMGAWPPAGTDALAAAPAFPVNGHGSFVAGVPGEQGLQWFAGSTFHASADLCADLAQEHAMNRRKLQALLPLVADALAGQFDQQQVQGWQGTRCVTHDRLPLVGPLDAGEQPALWLCAGMGARGLSFSALCAELLAAWLGGEPLPLESSMAQSLSTQRSLRRKRQPAGAPGASSAAG
ncbi:MAG: FAD-dependent oxidoreductase [Rhodoferax sp.]|nr:FAD-dependent oxidoreductase [Rhodoferax sp.]